MERKILKSNLKGKIRITEALLIGFLITGKIVVGGDELPNKESIIIMEEVNLNSGNPIPNGIIANGSEFLIEDHTTIDVKETHAISDGKGSNGIKLNKSGVTIKNRGTVSASFDAKNGEIKTAGNGNGINSSDRISLENYGVIKGKIYAENSKISTEYKDSGNGVISGGLGKITNYGTIIGENIVLNSKKNTILRAGSGVTSNWTINDYISNYGIIIGKSKYSIDSNGTEINMDHSGNGIGSMATISKYMKNTGVISGEAYIKNETEVANANNTSLSFYNSGNGINIHTTGSPSLYGVENSGVIKGSIQGIAGNGSEGIQMNSSNNSSGNGITGNKSITKINNSGIIIGNIYSEAQKQSGQNTLSNMGNGIYAKIIEVDGEILNSGVISGFSKKEQKYSENTHVGSGISLNKNPTKKTEGYIENSGLIKGSQSAISISSSSPIGNGEKIFINYGIMAGREIIGNGFEQNLGWSSSEKKLKPISDFDENYGVYIKLKETKESESNQNINVELGDNGNPVIKEIIIGSIGKTIDEKKILNGLTDGTIAKAPTIITENKNTYTKASNLIEISNLIINGVGRDNGALTVDKSIELENSIINGYETALTINADNKFKGTDIIFNGGGLGTYNKETESFEYVAVIKGDTKDNILEILGKSVINGDIDLKGGDDNLIVSSATQINGNIDGGVGIDKLQLGNYEPNEDYKYNKEHPLNNHDGNGDGIIDKGDWRGLAIYHEIKNFENIDVKGAVTLYETAKITGESKIHIGKESSLNLRIDPTQKDEKDRVIGHALYTAGNKEITAEKHDLTVDLEEYWQNGDKTLYAEGGSLNIITNGLGVGGVIAMSGNGVGSVKLDSNKESFFVRTDSIIHSATVHTGNESKAIDYSNAEIGDIKITVNPDLITVVKPPVDPPINPPVDPPIDPEPPVVNPDVCPPLRYNQLNKIYKSLIADGDNINAIYPTTSITLLKQYLDYPVQSESAITDMALGNLLTLLNEVYTASPYSFSSELSKESLGMYSDVITDNPFKANEDNWMFYGGLLHESVDLKDRYYAKHYHGFDTFDKTTNIKAENKITGAYALAEYGVNNTLSVGGVLGGSKNKSKISNGSSLDGNAFYLGGYFKKDIDEWRVLGGVGYQFVDYDAKRKAGNMMQNFSYDNNYDDNGLNVYLSARYNYALGNNYFLVPKAKLSYTYIDQDSVNEGDKPLAMNVNSKSFDIFEGIIGVDLKKEFTHNNAKSAIKFGVDYTHLFKGYEDDYLTANMKNGSDFDILVPNRLKNKYSVGLGYEYENEKGILFNLNGRYSFEASENNSVRDNSNTKNKENGWIVGLGLGYKFNSVEELIPEVVEVPVVAPISVITSKELKYIPIVIEEVKVEEKKPRKQKEN